MFRVCRAVFARLDGEGARRAGGRWNSPGKPVVYMAETVALAVLENLVHMSRSDFPSGYVLAGAMIPARVKIMTRDDLVAVMGDQDTQILGDYWLNLTMSAVLAVRSVVVPHERNFLLNPRHPEFREIIVEMPQPFHFDQRLFGGM